ncbi:MAG: hypothetical protein HKP13_11140, partial [Gammaproteobacteria bacterium]|nr:hypothetical protein [Gammaproteobacteria bacterium]
MEEKIRRALETPEEIASLQRQKDELNGEVERLKKTLLLTEEKQQRARLELEGDNSKQALRIGHIEAAEKALRARVGNCEKDKRLFEQRLIAKNEATVAACQGETRECRAELERIKQDCVPPTSNIGAFKKRANIETIKEGKTVYLVREGGEKEVVFSLPSNWEYLNNPLLNSSSTLLSVLVKNETSHEIRLIIKDSLDSLSRRELAIIYMAGIKHAWNLRWAEDE